MPPPLQVDLLTLKVVSESHVTWSTSVLILVFLGLSVLELGPMYATDVRQTWVSYVSTAGSGAAQAQPMLGFPSIYATPSHAELPNFTW